jgi:RNA polymerase primary sigma factor
MPQHDASLKSYLNEISRYPLLTPEQEIVYGRQVTRMNEVIAKGEPYTKEEARDIRVGKQAKHKFMRSNLKLVVSIAKKYSGDQRKSLDLMDLVQEGNIGLARAVELFDPSRGYRFTTYAYWWIRQSIHRSISQIDALVRLPTSLYDKVVRTSTVTHQLQQELGRMPTSEEVAAKLDVPVDMLLMGVRRNQMHSSLDATPSTNEDGSAIVDMLVDPAQVDHYESIERMNLSNKAMQVFEHRLDPLTQCVLISRFAETPVSWRELHKQFKLSISRLQTIERNGLRLLRAEMGVRLPKEPD